MKIYKQTRSLNVILTRDDISQAEIELWAKNFSDNYACSCSFRDFAKKKGFMVYYSDFTDVEERIQTMDKAYNYLKELVHNINTADINMNYPQLVFYGTDNDTGEHYSNTYVDEYIRVLDSDSTFKSQKIEVSQISEDKVS